MTPTREAYGEAGRMKDEVWFGSRAHTRENITRAGMSSREVSTYGQSQGLTFENPSPGVGQGMEVFNQRLGLKHLPCPDEANNIKGGCAVCTVLAPFQSTCYKLKLFGKREP